MTKYEKITTVLSILAIGLAGATPFITYHWLDPALKNFKQRARLQVSSSKESSDFHMKVIRKIIVEGNDESESLPISFDVEIVNVGEMPAKDVQLVAQYDSRAPDSPSITFDPPTQYQVVTRANRLFISVGRPIAARDKLKSSFKDYPSRVSVSNEFGETSTLDTDLGWFHRSAELRDEINRLLDSQQPNKRLERTRR